MILDSETLDALLILESVPPLSDLSLDAFSQNKDTFSDLLHKIISCHQQGITFSMSQNDYFALIGAVGYLLNQITVKESENFLKKNESYKKKDSN